MTQQPEYIGCIDGSTIVLHRQADEFVLTIDGVEARLSREAAIRLANLLPSTITSSRPSNKRRRQKSIQQLVKKRSYPETIADLMEEGLIQIGTVLTLRHQNVDRYGTITVDGKIEIDGHQEDTPSAAGRWVIGRECNGWATWKLRDGKSLADLRWILRATRFLGDDHGYVTGFIKEKRRIALGWVEYALSEGLEPGVRNDARAEKYMEARQKNIGYHYTETTLDSYWRHLRQWFEWCKANNW